MLVPYAQLLLSPERSTELHLGSPVLVEPAAGSAATSGAPRHEVGSERLHVGMEQPVPCLRCTVLLSLPGTVPAGQAPSCGHYLCAGETPSTEVWSHLTASLRFVCIGQGSSSLA